MFVGLGCLIERIDARLRGFIAVVFAGGVTGVEIEEVIGYLLRVGGRPENLALVVFEECNPGSDIARVIFDICGNAEYGSDEG